MELSRALPDRAFWAGQRVFLTGHTGFKGAWMLLWLERLGAQVFGYALAPDQTPDLYSQIAPCAGLISTFGDLADRAALTAAVREARPNIAIHMAAQPLVRRSYAQPVETFAANVMGVAHMLEALRDEPDLKAVLVVTTDKVYCTRAERSRNFVESDRLGGHDPYAASKAAAELVTASYSASFFRPRGVPVATARSGNVIGGGDWSEDRIVPDIWRALTAGRTLELRHPTATRPWQHVLDSLCGYFAFIEHMVAHPDASPEALNLGPALGSEQVTVAELVERFGAAFGAATPWAPAQQAGPVETLQLALDPSAAERTLGWRARLMPREAIGWTADWYRRHAAPQAARAIALAQIQDFEAL
ncbi:MAG TPA: CDP-glucose 4,6-dehydratase [Caulobacteraceae bacterium]|jgi:CDP-glucose 4,6-dehydratase|nr:CDP-glucose 4,6-dehydratase [Caulobacteraceae bacterium]